MCREGGGRGGTAETHPLVVGSRSLVPGSGKFDSGRFAPGRSRAHRNRLRVVYLITQ